MVIISNLSALDDVLNSIKYKSIGYVPTMGALHEGHLSLIQLAKKQSDFVIVTIYVNPTQFNDVKDFNKYPNTLEVDIQFLEQEKVDALYVPTFQDVYPRGTDSLPYFDINHLDFILEGKYRPGHFQGVCSVLHRFISLIKPAKLYLGEKDFQQVKVVDTLLKSYLNNLNVDLVIGSTVRNSNGLALSSRNKNLSILGIEKAGLLYQYVQNQIKKIQFKNDDPRQIEFKFKQFLLTNGFDSVDYIAIASPITLEPASDFNSPSRIFIAVFLEGVRLIDNFELS
jgi:pantoate--beta-alanine ligase